MMVVMTPQEKWAAVFAALGKACAELEAMGWPYPRKPAHITGYSRERGRRPVLKECR